MYELLGMAGFGHEVARYGNKKMISFCRGSALL